MEEMTIVLNGEKRSLRKGISVQELLAQFKVPSGTVVVEVNEDILPVGSHEKIHLKEGDRVELVRFVGGGVATEAPMPQAAAFCLEAARPQAVAGMVPPNEVRGRATAEASSDAKHAGFGDRVAAKGKRRRPEVHHG